MSALFDVPCPGCGQQLRPASDNRLQCGGCGEAYQLRMGHLFPSGEAESAGFPADAPGAATVSTP
jgi:hypothetical protein